MADDPNDFTDRYNTKLSAKDEAAFETWVKKQSAAVRRDVANDTYDYDLRGWWKANPGTDMNGGHLTDQFKKPNHPTFSTGSQYSGRDGQQGGEWGQAQDGSYTFTPGPTNLQFFSREALSDYFQKVEPGNRLLLPAQ